MKQATCSIVVLTRNRGHFLGETLRALISHDGPSREVLVFDNGSSDQTKAVAANLPVRYFDARHLGISEMRQRGIEESTAEIVIMCDDDCLPRPGWLEAIVGRFNANHRLALLGGKIVNVGFAGKCEKGVGAIGTNGLIKAASPAEATYFGAANLALRRSAVLECGGFDPFLVSGYEEGDIACCLRARGYETGFEASAVVDHHNIAATQRSRWRFRHADIMRLYFFLKHRRPEGAGWVGFAVQEFGIQARILIKWRDLSLGHRFFRVATTVVLLPWVLLRSGRARRTLSAGI